MAFKSSFINSSSSGESNKSSLKHQIQQKLKCFNCFGMTAKKEYCSHCGGTSYITDSHPLALLFTDVLYHKLDAMPIKYPEFDKVETIREEQEDLDERKIICDVCNKECDINYKYFCQCCECFFVCVTCAEQKGQEIDHQHPLATNKKLPAPDLKLRRTNSKQISSRIRINSVQDGEQNQNQNQSKQTNQENSDFLNVNTIINNEYMSIFQNIVKNHMSESNQFEQSDMGDSIIDCKKLQMFDSIEYKQSSESFVLRIPSDQRESITKSRGSLSKSKGLFSSSKEMEKKELHWEVSKEGEMIKIETQENFTSIFRQNTRPTNSSHFLFNSKISVHQSIDFNLFDTDAMGRSLTEPRQSFGFGRQSIILELCNGCGSELKDFYSVCRTCQKSKLYFKICCECEDTKSYIHDKSHEMEMVLGNLLGRKSQMVSESAIESDEQHDEFLQMKMSKKKSSLQKRPPRLPQSPSFDDLSGKKSFCKLKCSQSLDLNNYFNIQTVEIKENFGQESVINLDFEGLYNSTEFITDVNSKKNHQIKLLHKKSSLLQVNNSIEKVPNLSRFNSKHEEKPRVCFVQTLDEENIPIHYVDSDSQSEEESPKFIDVRKTLSKRTNRTSQKAIKSMKQIQFKQTEDKLLSSSSRQITSSIAYNRFSLKSSQRQQRKYQSTISQVEQKGNSSQVVEEQFIFHQYSCDQCGCHPIKNVRFHCLECEDYDLCEECYGDDIEEKHGHSFEKIDGLKKMLEQKAFLLQKKDLNKGGRDSLIRNSNSGIGSMLAKTKRTVQLMKKGMNQLNCNVMNVSKSFGSYGDFLGQRISLRQKVQS